METPTKPDRPLFIARLEKILDGLARRPLWPRRQVAYSPQGLAYATINRRMLAAMFDAVIISIVLLPFNGLIMRYAYGDLQFNRLQFNQALSESGTSVEALHSAFRTLLDSGMLHAFAVLAQIQFTVLAAYSFISWHFWAATPGKLLLFMRIVDARTGVQPADRQWVMRLVGYVISGVPVMLGFFAISWNRQSRGWHDYIAGTAVVVKGKTKPVENTKNPS